MLRTLACSTVLTLLIGSHTIVAQTEATNSSAVSLDHVAIYTSDLGKSVAFYKRVFGFPQLPLPFKAPIAFAWLDMGNNVALHIVSGRTEPIQNTRWDHLSIACPNMDSMLAHLNALGITWVDMPGKHEVQVRPDGVKQIFIRDPDGYWIEINDHLNQKP